MVAYEVQVCDIYRLKRSPMVNSPWMEVHNDHSPLVIATGEARSG